MERVQIFPIHNPSNAKLCSCIERHDKISFRTTPRAALSLPSILLLPQNLRFFFFLADCDPMPGNVDFCDPEILVKPDNRLRSA